MSDDFESIADEPENLAPLTHRRILIVMAAVAISGSLLGAVFVSGLFGLGVFIGGILSFVNYYWLKFSLKKIFEQAVGGDKPRFLGLRYLFRYLILGAVLTIVFLTETIPVVAVIAGLASFAVAIVIEGFVRIFSSFFKKKEV
ncbi:MAG TPA: ATP synthase subunit I [Pyrinomonadaceae bacterium]|nr:ATP synthase subunit I [Pyrinomonadaceae bacterium]